MKGEMGSVRKCFKGKGRMRDIILGGKERC